MTSNQQRSDTHRGIGSNAVDTRRRWTHPGSYLVDMSGSAMPSSIPLDARAEVALGKLLVIGMLGTASWLWVIGALAVAV